MLGRLVGFSLGHRFVVLTLALVLLGFGVITAFRSPMDVFPEFAPPQVTVETEAPGLSAEEVESLVTLRLELAIKGTPGLRTLRSTSMSGVSSITAIFRDGADVYRARQLVSERIATVVPDLPRSVVPPEIVPLTSASSTVEVVALTSAGQAPFDPIATRTFADWTLTPRILAVPGISKVVTYGGRVGQFQVVVRPSALRDYDLTLGDVKAAAGAATTIGPGGTTESHGQRFPIRVLSQAATPADIARAVVAFRESTPLLLSQVADVGLGPDVPIGDATLDGRPAVVLLVERQPGVNTLHVTADLDAALDEISGHLPPGLVLTRNLFRQASFIEQAIGNLRTSLFVGGILVVAVLIAFLQNVRTALISLIAIPLSLLTAVVVLRAFGATVNTMTLGGLAIALGEVVDDSIIDVENIHRRLRGSRGLPDPRPPRDVIFDASLEVRSAVVYATFLVALVFLPVFFLSGVAGKIFSPLGQAYVLSTLASLGVALLVTPAACSVLLGRESGAEGESRLAGFLKRRYAGILRRSLGRPRLLAVLALVLFVLAAAGSLFLGGEFIPAFEEHAFILHMAGLPGTSLAESVEAGQKVERRLLGIPGILSVTQRAGRAELADEVAGTESSELDVCVAPEVRNLDRTVEEIRHALSGFPGFSFAVSQFLKERIEEVAGGEAAPVAVSVYGPDLDRLLELGADVARTMSSIRGARDVSVEPLTRIPQIVIDFDRARAAQLGVSVKDLQTDVTTALAGSQVAEVFQGDRIVPVVVWYPKASREDPESIRALPVRTASGIVPLGSLADVKVRDLPSRITRQDGARRILITCDSARSISAFTRELKARLLGLPLPPGFSARVSGDYESQQRSLRELLLVALVSMVGIFLLLFTDLGSGRRATLVLVNLPLALIGGVGAALLFRVTLSLGALVGFVTLFGITARNAIMLISHYRHLEEREGIPFGEELVLQGSLDRLTPILMTALVTGLALLPLALSGSRAGQEIEHPMAVVIVGGLFSSTLLNLLLMPSFYLRWGRGRGDRAPSRAGRPDIE
ncbi:MAG: efflux RND transporter permease subunit [Acidithiobacillales bacterium]